jgi:protein-S-isoprenylcysteine O-methyltransferase Ste14
VTSLRQIVIAGWVIVFGGWLLGLRLDRAPVREAVVNRWRCRPYGITAGMVLACTVLEPERMRFRPPRRLSLLLLPVFVGGVLLYYWARLSLGRQWSSEARIANDHHLITNGAYRHVRHPIYLSKVLMALSSALMLGSRLVIALGLALAAAGLYQARVEEDMLRAHFPERHAEYAKRTGMLLPKVSLFSGRL